MKIIQHLIFDIHRNNVVARGMKYYNKATTDVRGFRLTFEHSVYLIIEI